MLYLYQRLILDPDNNVYVHMTVHESDNKIKSLSFFFAQFSWLPERR